MDCFLSPRRYVGLRSTGDEAAAVAQFQSMMWENANFYAFHPSDSGCKNSHVHFVILRDYDPTLPDATNAKQLQRKYISKTTLTGNAQYAFSVEIREA